MRDECQIQNKDGSHRSYACRAECDRLVREKVLRRLVRTKGSKPKYQLIDYPVPSSSQSSHASITEHDTRLLIGLQRIGSPRDEKGLDEAQARLERLIGFGLLPSNASLPLCGYL